MRLAHHAPFSLPSPDRELPVPAWHTPTCTDNPAVFQRTLDSPEGPSLRREQHRKRQERQIFGGAAGPGPGGAAITASATARDTSRHSLPYCTVPIPRAPARARALRLLPTACLAPRKKAKSSRGLIDQNGVHILLSWAGKWPLPSCGRWRGWARRARRLPFRTPASTAATLPCNRLSVCGSVPATAPGPAHYTSLTALLRVSSWLC